VSPGRFGSGTRGTRPTKSPPAKATLPRQSGQTPLTKPSEDSFPQLEQVFDSADIRSMAYKMKTNGGLQQITSPRKLRVVNAKTGAEL
jgi:hypothetical protein